MNDAAYFLSAVKCHTTLRLSYPPTPRWYEISHSLTSYCLLHKPSTLPVTSSLCSILSINGDNICGSYSYLMSLPRLWETKACNIHYDSGDYYLSARQSWNVQKVYIPVKHMLLSLPTINLLLCVQHNTALLQYLNMKKYIIWNKFNDTWYFR